MATTTHDAAGSDPILQLQSNGAGTEKLKVTGAGQIQVGDGSVSSPILSFLSDANTGLFRSSADTIDFATAGTQALRIDSSQRISINGQSPGTNEMLAIGGASAGDESAVNVGIHNSGTGNCALNVLTDTNQAVVGGLGSGAAGNWWSGGPARADSNYFQSSAASKMFIFSDTNSNYFWTSHNSGFWSFNIGLTPTEALRITSGGVSVRASDGSASAPDITFLSDADTGIFKPAANAIGFTVGGQERMRIAYSGYVGIGTTNPQASLEIADAWPSFRLTYNGASPNRYWEMHMDPSSLSDLYFQYLDSNGVGQSGPTFIGNSIRTTSLSGYAGQYGGQIHARGSQNGLISFDWDGTHLDFYSGDTRIYRVTP